MRGPSRRRLGAVLIPLLVVVGCSTTDDDPTFSGKATTTETSAPTPTFTGDGSSFCDAMLGVGKVERQAGDTRAQVMADNEELMSLLDEAQANTPEDAPPDFDLLLDDYRAAALAIAASGGDVDKAFEALTADSPAVVRRLGSSRSHQPAYEFLVERCGFTDR